MPEHPSFESVASKWLGKSELESNIINSNEPKIEVFVANWCGFCKRFINRDTKDNLSKPIAIVDADSEGGSPGKSIESS